ncbi:MAG: hypothetical protein KatS3mg126_0459 [Lysobacteraceae bacterium]|nr:MAG: hypothetical protein KatS3mg126_0459 [Xanthomonadaceae bacterium]
MPGQPHEAGRVAIRTACAEDAAAMVALHHEAVWSIPATVYPRHVLAAWAPRPDAARERWMRSLIEGERHLGLVAEREGVLVGFALCEAGEGFLQALYVSPRHHGCGVGRALLEACERVMRERGHRVARVLASRNAAAFYRGAGYRELGAATQLLHDGSLLDCVEMVRTLAQDGPSPGARGGSRA